MKDKNELNVSEDEIERLYYEALQERESLPARRENKLPKVVEEYTNDATKVSMYNGIPAAITFFNLLGQLCKDMVAVPGGPRRDDTRVHFLWMQTSGFGKSELWNFYGPICKYVFDELNEKYPLSIEGFPLTKEDAWESYFTTCEAADINDAGLVGSMTMVDEVVEDDDGRPSTIKVPEQIWGELEGDGIVAYDEFEYSGVFKQSQHKENTVMYFNKMINSKWGSSWIIPKRLLNGGMMECRSQRSLYATTYIPTTLAKLIAEKGIMQRCLIFIFEVPISLQDEMRDKWIDAVGTIENRDLPIVKHGNEFVKIYDALKEHYEENGSNPETTIKFGKGFNDALKNEAWKMRNHITNTRPAVMDIASNFITRMLGTMTRISVLCCIAESAYMKDKSKRYIVTARHVNQASSLTRQCYKSLVSWLDIALRAEKATLEEKSKTNDFITAYNSLLEKGGTVNRQPLVIEGEWIHKATLLNQVKNSTGRGQATIYRYWKKGIEKLFDTRKMGSGQPYVRLKKEE
tara:strand:+ start:2697 stop:4250 length:1554 start_codon:yes stop_codon:yes gene_type:complete